MSNSGGTTTQQKPKTDTITNTQENRAPISLLMSFDRIVRGLVLYFCRRIIFGPIQFKLITAFVIIVVGSILKTKDLAPNSYLSRKSNVFNQYFVKLGWAWTIGLLGPFIYLTLSTTHSTYQIVTRHLVRLLIATGIWYVITKLFVQIDALTGSCNHEDMRSASRIVCVKEGHTWIDSWDFSGHTFLLLYAILIINEEVKPYDRGIKTVDKANKSSSSAAAAEGGNTRAIEKQERLDIYSKLIRVVYVALAGLTILWEIMLLSTALYFHHALHKIWAAIFAVFFWYITYYYWYRNDGDSLLYPAKPKN